MGTLPSKDEGMGMCWSWFSASKWQESQRIGVLFLDWEWVKICQNDESIPQNRWLSTTKNCYFCGSKRYTANGLAENAAFPLAVPSISIRTPLSTRHLQIQMLATEKIRFRQLDFTKECRNVSKTQGYSRRGLVLFPSKITQPWEGMISSCMMSQEPFGGAVPATSSLHDAHVPQILWGQPREAIGNSFSMFQP